MRLNVKESTKVIGAKMFQQKNAGITTEFPTGSTGYSNCTGLCIWNRLGNVGIVAHIEAADDNYPAVFEDVCKKLLEKINQQGGHQGSFSIVIFGAAATEKHSVLFEKSLYNNFGKNLRLNSLDIMDMRNGTARGKIGRAPIIGKNFYGAGVLDPSTETFYLSAFGTNLVHEDSKKVEVFSIQK